MWLGDEAGGRRAARRPGKRGVRSRSGEATEQVAGGSPRWRERGPWTRSGETEGFSAKMPSRHLFRDGGSSKIQRGDFTLLLCIQRLMFFCIYMLQLF